MSHVSSFGFATANATINTVTGNSGGPVGPLAGNLNIVGAGGVLVTGNPATHTQTISVTGVVPETFDADSGSATSALGIINFFGGPGIVTSASGNTVTITANDAAPAYTNVNASPYNVLATDYYLSVDCSAAPITLNFSNAATLSRAYVIKDRTGSSAVHNITITTFGGAVNIDGVTSFIMKTPYQSVNMIGNNVSYEIF